MREVAGLAARPAGPAPGLGTVEPDTERVGAEHPRQPDRDHLGQGLAASRRGPVILAAAAHGAILEIFDKIVNNPGGNIFNESPDHLRRNDLAADY